MWQCFVSKKETAGRKITYLSVFEYFIKINVCWKEKLLSYRWGRQAHVHHSGTWSFTASPAPTGGTRNELEVCIGKLGELLPLSSNYREPNHGLIHPVISGGIWVALITRAMGWICIALTARSSQHQGKLLQIWPASLDFPGQRNTS